MYIYLVSRCRRRDDSSGRWRAATTAVPPFAPLLSRPFPGIADLLTSLRVQHDRAVRPSRSCRSVFGSGRRCAKLFNLAAPCLVVVILQETLHHRFGSLFVAMVLRLLLPQLLLAARGSSGRTSILLCCRWWQRRCVDWRW